MIALAAFALVALATEPAAALLPAPASSPSASRIVARNRAAAGPQREGDERESWAVRSSGLGGTLEVVRQGSDCSATMLLGPFRTQRGIVHGQRWHQNENGETVLERSEPSQAERSLSETVERVREPGDAWLVTTTFAGGRVTRTYYDARSYLIVRIEKTAGGRTTRTTFDDFRTDVRGRTRAAHFFGGGERPGTEFDYHLLRDDPAAAVRPAELAVPSDRRALAEFPAGATSVRLPARIERGRIYVRLAVNGRELDFLLDSGSSNITIDEGAARSLGLTAFGRTAETAAGTFEAQRVVARVMRFGPLVMHDVVMRTGPVANYERTHVRVVGLLGFDFFDAVGLEVDYAAGTVEALRPGGWVPPPGSVPLAIGLGAQVPITAVTVGEATGDDFIVDTGAQFALVLFQRFMRAHGGTAGAVAVPGVRYGNGVGGPVPYRPLAVQHMTLGPLAFSRPGAVLALPASPLGLDMNDGLVGSGILERFSVFFDYARGRLYLAAPTRPPAPQGLHARAPSLPLRGDEGALRPETEP